MFDHMTNDARWAVRRGEDLARAAGAPAIESEHLLIALSERDGTSAQRALADVGLTPGRLAELIAEEHARSLRFAGVEPTVIAAVPSRGSLRLATSTKSTLIRAVASARTGAGKGIDSGRLLGAIIDQRSGTVPRLLALAGVDRAALMAAVAPRAK
jgi:ATP-dependent Clp protease ATP-binding subunit ClpA